MKSVVLLKANPGTLKCGGGIKIWIWLCVEKQSYFGLGNSQNKENRKKYCETKKDAKRVVYMAMDQKAREAVEKVDSSYNGNELFRIAKQTVGEKKDIVGVSCLKGKSDLAKFSVDD